MFLIICFAQTAWNNKNLQLQTFKIPIIKLVQISNYHKNNLKFISNIKNKNKNLMEICKWNRNDKNN